MSVLRLAEQAVSDYPRVAKFWCIRGDLIQLAPERYTLGRNDVLASYVMALVLDTRFAEAYESIGYFLDTYDDNFIIAEAAFRKAIKIRPTPDSYAGLARVLAEQHRSKEALQILKRCPFSKNAKITELIQEIKDGIWT